MLYNVYFRHIGIIFHIGPIFTFKALSADIGPIISCIPNINITNRFLAICQREKNNPIYD